MKHYSTSWMLACGSLLVLAVPTISGAQEKDSDTVEEVVVTGSRIVRKDLNSVGPVTILTAPEIAATGISSLEVLLQRMPSSAGSGGNQTSAYWVSNGWGTPQINLRGMGINRTLVLLNGRRLVNGGTGANTAVDLSMIPVSIIERIEVLKDGASAVYGADAVAGVVNIITKQRFEGVETTAKVGAAFDGDGEEVQLDLTWGVTNDRGSLMASVSYQDTGEVFMPDRVDCPKSEVNGALVCVGSSSTIGGRALLPDGTRINFNQDPNGDGDAWHLYDPLIDNFDYNQSFNAVNPLERLSFSAFGNYELTDRVEIIGELMFTNRQTGQPASPTTVNNIPIPASHPTNPTGQDLFVERRRMAESGDRNFFQETNTYRIVVGIQSEINDAWSWDVTYNLGRNTGTDGSTNIVNLVRLNETLDTAVCGSGGIPCADILGYGDITPEVFDYILFTMNGTGGNEQESLSANISGQLFDIPAGPVMMAAGVESRQDKGWRDPDSLVVIGSANTNAADPISGTVKTDEIYIELGLPLLSGMRFTEALDLDLAFRYSDYETFGSTDNYKIGLNWQVVPSFKLRANYATSFRVPNVNELFGGVAEGNLTTTDPCSGWSALPPTSVVYINCQADGVPPGFTQLGNTILTTVGGNTALNPETADTFTLGLVFQPSFVDGLSVTLDYYDVEIQNAITQIPGSTKLNVCYNTPNLDHQFCNDDHFTRSALSGDVNFLSAQPVNTGKETINGVDFGLRYNVDIKGIATTFDWQSTLLNEYEITPFDGADPIVKDGHIGGGNGGYSRQQSYVSMNLQGQKWAANYAIQVIGSGDDFNAVPPAIGSEIDTVMYHYIQGSYEISDSANVAVGIDNIFDEGAPYVASWTDGNTDTMTYDLIGRRGYVRFTYIWE
ncbi:MAG TPA: TonB-dependent receptor [Woeseiaceae bacterium]|nr:TonB-dependent receptor [Woeseiaceae bacterium]